MLEPPLPVAGQPTQVCAVLLNTDTANALTVNLVFSIADFGIGVPFNPIGSTSVTVPSGQTTTGCVVWVPPETGHWCIRVVLQQEQSEPLVAQRNVDIWERLIPEVEATMAFQVGPFPIATTVELVPEAIHPRWQVWITPPFVELEAHQVGEAVLHLLPPAGEPLGTGEVIVDVEGWVRGEMIGGFRKLDWPPVSLHHPGEPFFAESEISIWPYPPRAGEPTEICAELHNKSDMPQTVVV